MNLKKTKDLKYLIIFFILSIIPELIKSQNLCPFYENDDVFLYYAKGINPSKCDKCSDYKWQYIHCVNNYFNKTLLLYDDKDDYFNKNAGFFIGSSINIGKFTEEFINTSLSDLKEIDRENLIKLIGKYGDEAKETNITFNFSLKEINYINEKVYEEYYKEMMEYFKSLSLKEKNYGFSFELNLLTFFVKYYGMNDYLSQAKECLSENKNNNLILLSYFFLNIKSVGYFQKKLWSLVTLSSDQKYCNYNVSHIGIYHDSKLKHENHKDFKIFLEKLVLSFESKEYYYSLGNYTGLYSEDPKNKEEFYDDLNKYDLYNNDTIKEDINEGIQHFEQVFDKYIKGIHSFYQRHLIIFINDIKTIGQKINTDYFITNGIQVILVAKINKKSDEEKINEFFDDNINIITYYDYTKLNTSLKYLRGAINFNVQNYFYKNISEKIKINNIITSSKDNMQYFRIIFNKELIPTDEWNYFHISLTYSDPKKIETLYKNNSNITFLVSQKNPYADIKSYDVANFCFNTTVSSSENNSPYINYILNDKTKDYFYISIMANDMSYSLTINFNSTPFEPQKSNGEYEKYFVIPNESELVATFSDKIIQQRCNVDYFSLLKYYSSGVHYTNDYDTFHKIIDMNMMECLYKNIYGPFFEMGKEGREQIKYEDGPLIGYGIYLSKESCVKLKRDNIPLYLINKLYPFLSNSIDIKKAKETLENYNLNLTYEEISILNINYLSNIVKDLESSHNRKFNDLSDNLKLALILRIIEQHSSSQQIEQYLNYLTSNNIDKYLQELNTTMISRMSTGNSLNFQMMLTQTKNIYKPRKCLLSFVIGKTLLLSDEFFELISKINNYRISITYYDPLINQTELLTDFTEDINEIQEKIIDIKNTSTFEHIDKIDIDLILKKQKDLFKYYDEGIKKCIVIVSTRDANKYKYEFTKPNHNLLKELNEIGILLFDYSDHINFISEDNNDHYNFFNSSKSQFIQFVPFLNYSDMSNNYLSLTNMINRYPIPINKLEDIYLDLEPDEEIFFEFNLEKEIKNIKKKNNNLFNFNQLRFNFDISGIKIYFSDKFIYPNNYSNDVNFLIDEETNTIYYEIKEEEIKEEDKKENKTNKFFMSIQTSNKVDNSFIKLDLCDKEGKCLKNNFYFKFYISFIVIGCVIFFYGIYICFCETTFKKESNIFERK